MSDQQWEEIKKNARTKASEKKRRVEAQTEAKRQGEAIKKREIETAEINRLNRREKQEKKEEEVTLNLNRALKEVQEKKKTLDIKEKERKKVVHATDDAPKKPVRKLKSEVVKMTGKELQKAINKEARALKDANRNSNLKEMAVKIIKMGPEIHADYVKDKKNSGSEEVAAGGSSVGNTPVIKKIPLLRDMSKGKWEVATEVCKDPRLNQGDIPKFI